MYQPMQLGEELLGEAISWPSPLYQALTCMSMVTTFLDVCSAVQLGVSVKAVATDFEVVRPGSGCGLFNVGVVCLM